jgi:membrane protease YdiL (CAAX protease family)
MVAHLKISTMFKTISIRSILKAATLLHVFTSSDVLGFQNGIVGRSSQASFSPSSHISPKPLLRQSNKKYTTYLSSTNEESEPAEIGKDGPLEIGKNDDLFDIATTLFLVGGQSLLVVAAAIVAKLCKVPNFGLGPGIDFSASAIQQGFVMTLPLAVFAFVLDKVEDRFPALQDVTKATQRSVLALLGGTFKPLIGIIVATGLGLAAGFGEEMLFRGVLQYDLISRIGTIPGVLGASVIFGALHAVTPLYATLAGVASIYFGYLYLSTGNLAGMLL